MSNSMSFSTANLSSLLETATEKKTAKSSNGKNAQFYKERMESHINVLAGHSDRTVRLAVASSAHASATCLKAMLLNEVDEEIIGVILGHQNLSKTVKTAYVQKNRELIQSIIDKADVDSDGPSNEEIEDALSS